MRTPRLLVGLGLGLGLLASPAVCADLKDLYYGEALFHVYQGQFFDALQRLDTELAQYHGLDEPRLDSLYYHINDAEFAVGDLELDYRMHLRAGRAVKAVLEGAVDESVRNEAAFRLARINFQKGQLDDAQSALARIQGAVPARIKDDVEFLRANIDMATSHPGDAVKVLQQERWDGGLAGFASYNLGIALFQDGRTPDAIDQLDKAGVRPTAEKRVFKSQKFAGKSFVFTGALANRSREEAAQQVMQHGAKISSSVSKKTDYVVVGADPGSKYDKAKELGVPVLTEGEFEKLLRTT